MKEIEEEIEELEEEFEDEYDVQRREGLLSRFFSLLRSKPASEEDYYENPELDEDIKEVLKISFMWLNKLPPHHMKEFKSSGDFETCKELLIRYGIAKEK